MSTPATSTTATTTTTVYSIDPSHSEAGFAVRHLMISTVRGTFHEIEGTVQTSELTPGEVDVNVRVKVSSIDTREPQRDAHLKSADFFDAANFPEMTFRGRRVIGQIDGPFTLVGDLTIRGTTREITLEVEPQGTLVDPWGNRRAGFSATARINRSDFGLMWNQALETGGVVVGDEVKISVDLELIKQG